MFPLYDESRASNKIPWVTILLIIVNVALFLISFANLDQFIEVFGLVPEEFLTGENRLGILTSMFLHAGFGHLLGNMWFLWVFGDNLERHLGKFKFLVFYLLCGICSGLIYCLLAVDKTIPVIGASGAISGVLGGYLVCFPKNKIRALVPVFYFIHILSIPAFIYLGIWFLYQFLYMNVDPFIAYWGHIGGFISGMILILFFRKSKG